MKCSTCQYLKPCYESTLFECKIFGEDIPDEYIRKDGEGCICNSKQLAKMYEVDIAAWLEDIEKFVDWLTEKAELKEKDKDA